MFEVIDDLRDPNYLYGFIEFVLIPFEQAIYISGVVLGLYLAGGFITAIVTHLIKKLVKGKVKWDEYDDYWQWSWLGLTALLYNSFKLLFRRETNY